MTNTVYLFVYGTLSPSAEHAMGRLLRDNAQLVGTGRIRACLYKIDDPEEPGNSYPGAVPSGYDEDHVHGQLYALTKPEVLLPRFDVYEACDPSRPEPHEFVRGTIPVVMDGGDTLLATAYLYAWDVSRAQRIRSGRYTDVSPDVR